MQKMQPLEGNAQEALFCVALSTRDEDVVSSVQRCTSTLNSKLNSDSLTRHRLTTCYGVSVSNYPRLTLDYLDKCKRDSCKNEEIEKGDCREARRKSLEFDIGMCFIRLPNTVDGTHIATDLLMSGQSGLMDEYNPGELLKFALENPELEWRGFDYCHSHYMADRLFYEREERFGPSDKDCTVVCSPLNVLQREFLETFSVGCEIDIYPSVQVTVTFSSDEEFDRSSARSYCEESHSEEDSGYLEKSYSIW